MRTFNGLKRGLGYFTSRPLLPLQPNLPTDPAVWTDEVLQVWYRRAERAQSGRAQAWALYHAGEHLRLGRSALEAIKRLDLDEKRRVEQISMVLDPLGVQPPAPPSAPLHSSGTALQQAAQLVLAELCTRRSTRGAVTYALRSHTDDPAGLQLIQRLSSDAVAHADLGFLLWPLLEHRLLQVMEPRALHTWLDSNLRSTFAQLDRTLGLDAQRTGIDLSNPPEPPRPNAGVLPPLTGAAALYQHVPGALCRRLERLNMPATQAWQQRHTPSPAGWAPEN